MRFERAYIPVGSPGRRRSRGGRGALSEVNSLDMAVDVTRAAFERRGFSAEALTGLVLGGPCRREISSTAHLRLLPVSGLPV